MLYLLLSFTAAFMPNALLILLTICIPSSCDLAAQHFRLPLPTILSTSLMQEITRSLSHSALFLINSGTPYLLLYFPLPMTHLWGFQDIYTFPLVNSLTPAWGLTTKWAFCLFILPLAIFLHLKILFWSVS